MHEVGIVQSILDTVEPAAREAGAARVSSVALRIGEMREVVPEALAFAWEALCSERPLMAGTELSVENVAPKSACNACGAEFAHDRFHCRCPQCGSADTRVLAGRELEIASIEIEE